MKTFLGFLLAAAIGVTCRLSGIPLPAPPALIGALLVLAMTIGFVITDRMVPGRQAKSKELCGGPTGNSQEDSQ